MESHQRRLRLKVEEQETAVSGPRHFGEATARFLLCSTVPQLHVPLVPMPTAEAAKTTLQAMMLSGLPELSVA